MYGYPNGPPPLYGRGCNGSCVVGDKTVEEFLRNPELRSTAPGAEKIQKLVSEIMVLVVQEEYGLSHPQTVAALASATGAVIGLGSESPGEVERLCALTEEAVNKNAKVNYREVRAPMMAAKGAQP